VRHGIDRYSALSPRGRVTEPVGYPGMSELVEAEADYDARQRQ